MASHNRDGTLLATLVAIFAFVLVYALLNILAFWVLPDAWKAGAIEFITEQSASGGGLIGAGVVSTLVYRLIKGDEDGDSESK